MSNKKTIIIITASVLAAVALIAGLTVWLVNVFKSDDKSVSSGKSGDAVITVESVSEKVGKNIKIPVKFTGNPGAMGFFLQFEYDTEALEYLNFEKGELLTDCEVSEQDGTLKLVSVEDNDITKDGVMVYLNFKIKDNATGMSEIKLICDENSVCNYDEQSVPVKTENGKVTVK